MHAIPGQGSNVHGSTIAPDSRHISLESFQSLSTHRLAGFYLIALLDRGRVSGQHLLLPAVQHSWRTTTNREPSLSSPALPTSAPYGYKTPRTEFAHFEQRQISSAIRTFESTTTRRRLKRRAAAGDRGQEEKILIHPPGSRLGSIKRETPVLLFHNGQPCLARPNRLTEGARSKISRQHLATTTQANITTTASLNNTHQAHPNQFGSRSSSYLWPGAKSKSAKH
ncbi:hypothetical protein CCUS01_09982 [Colletotrichum cuscutae]|uniref:Uncharacterized protein n=1 Tax=Colletotrichum cuscutae TaxID=1209917 RepID=A0AAI9UDV1_9PEZI|nr:hypothetical protein CCUS01_09982 [Colletotrichum cuscutae]